MINSQREAGATQADGSISKGMGDQFSAGHSMVTSLTRYIKGDG